MISSTTEIWTDRGWRRHQDIMIGEKVISFNADKNVCEYDYIKSIYVTQHAGGMMGIKKFGMNQSITPDHDILIFDKRDRSTERKKACDIFMKPVHMSRGVLYHRPLNQFIRTNSDEELKWSARVCAVYAQSKYFASDRSALTIAQNLNGLDSRVWLDTFYHWNVLQPGVNWMKSILLRNKEVRDKIFDIAHRAGIGAYWSPHRLLTRKKGNMWCMSVSNATDVHVGPSAGWNLHSNNSLVFNIKTNNGTFLARRQNGTFIMACEGTM